MHFLICYYHIRQLRCIHPYLDFKTASTIATSIVHSKLDYCNSLCHNLPDCQLNRLQQIQNSLARAVVKAPKSTHITSILKSLHWLKVNKRIEYKFLTLTYKVLTTTQPSYLHNLISLQPPRSSRSSSVVTLSLSPANHLLLENHRSLICITSSLKSTSRFIPSASPFSSRFTSSSTSQLISVIIPTLIIHHSFVLSLQAQNLPFQQILSTVDFFYPLDCLVITGLDRTSHAHQFIFSFTFIYFCLFRVVD